jgi:hypothetical protein
LTELYYLLQNLCILSTVSMHEMQAMNANVVVTLIFVTYRFHF